MMMKGITACTSKSSIECMCILADSVEKPLSLMASVSGKAITVSWTLSSTASVSHTPYVISVCQNNACNKM